MSPGYALVCMFGLERLLTCRSGYHVIIHEVGMMIDVQDAPPEPVVREDARRLGNEARLTRHNVVA